MTHLSLDERLALIEAEGEPEHPHLAECARCLAEVSAARIALADAGRVPMPEPSPLFWDHFSRRVSEQVAAIAHEPVGRSRAPWRLLVPLAVGVAALIMTVVIDRRPVAHETSASLAVPNRAVDESPSGAAGDDAQWLVLSQAAEGLDPETLSDSLGMSGAGDVESAVWELTEQERAELTALMRAEIRRGSSGS